MTNPAPTALATSATITLKGRTVSRADVFSVLADCDRLGKTAFLALHGYRDSAVYHLRHSGRSYPSKAILGAAAGLSSTDFFGGAAHTVAQLGTLGFHVRNSKTGELVHAAGFESFRADAVAAGFDDPAPEWKTLPVAPSAYFASGSNRPAQIAALGKLGADVGVAAPELSPAGIAELKALAGSDVLAFVDSGAFSEVKFDGIRWNVVKPITHTRWTAILDLYEELAEVLGSQLYCVAPDQVGSQAVTLERLRRYAPRIRNLIAKGARVLVAIQKGTISQGEFARLVRHELGDGWIPALPCKKAATSPAELEAFLDSFAPSHVHLLGLGVRNPQAKKYLGHFVGRETSVSLDSCWLSGNVGKARGGKKERRFTKALRIGSKVLEAAGRLTSRLRQELAFALCLGGPVVA